MKIIEDSYQLVLLLLITLYRTLLQINTELCTAQMYSVNSNDVMVRKCLSDTVDDLSDCRYCCY